MSTSLVRSIDASNAVGHDGSGTTLGMSQCVTCAAKGCAAGRDPAAGVAGAAWVAAVTAARTASARSGIVTSLRYSSSPLTMDAFSRGWNPLGNSASIAAPDAPLLPVFVLAKTRTRSPTAGTCQCPDAPVPPSRPIDLVHAPIVIGAPGVAPEAMRSNRTASTCTESVIAVVRSPTSGMPLVDSVRAVTTPTMHRSACWRLS